MVKRFEDLYYEGDVYGALMDELYGLRERLEECLDSDSGVLLGLIEEFWLWSGKANRLEKEAFERGETNWNGDEEYEAGRNLRWILEDLSYIIKLDGHQEEKALLETYQSYYTEHYQK